MDPISIALSVAKFAPTVAKWLGGSKAEDAAKKVVSIAEKITGKKRESVEKALAADPNLQMKFKMEILANETEMDKLYLEDVKDARNRDLELRRMGYRNTRADTMLIIAGISLCLCIYLVAQLSMEDSVLAIFHMAIGALLKMLGDGFHFEFGSSRGSKEKDISR